MKCPKCGYNSFEYHNSCKKCSNDLGAYKLTHNITPIILPPEARALKANEFRSAASTNEQPVEHVEMHDDMFSFDLPEDNAPPSYSPSAQNDDPFNFDDDLPAVAPPKTEDRGFADLLESTSQSDNDPFAASVSSASPAKPQPAAPSPGEFDLENFSWDDTPVSTASSAGQVSTDDFDSLFGGKDEDAKK